MKITRIARLKAYRLFRDFAWPKDLPAFARFNVIYGWNGTGKTTLAALFRNLQDRTDLAAGEVVLEVDETLVDGSAIATAVLPPVRVFNRDFVAAAVLASERQMAPIYFLGRDSVEKQQQVEKLKKDLARAEALVKTSQSGKASADRGVDEFCISKARLIKELLISARSATYNNYDKRRFRQAIERMDLAGKVGALLPEEERAKLRSKKDAQPKPDLAAVDCRAPSFATLTVRAKELLEASVEAQVIDVLASDREIGAWVRQGLALHTGSRRSVDCLFCGQAVPPTRLAALAAHFNDEFLRFDAEVQVVLGQIEGARKELAEVSFPEASRLYDHLSTEFCAAVVAARATLGPGVTYLDRLQGGLAAKRECPFKRATFEDVVEPSSEAIREAMAAVNEVIGRHNATTSRFHGEVEAACQALEACYVAEGYDDFVRLRDRAAVAESSVAAAVAKAQGLREEIASIEREIVEHRRPAEELNAELHAYLGRDELRFEVQESGYSMTRGGLPASGLSEGEKTAIAFLYFLKSLQDKSFDLANGVVVIDDPVSSLDANALFSAFGFMKERTKDAGQLFVLTHNFSFFRQVKNWYHHLPGQGKKDPAKRPARFYLLRASAPGGHRQAELAAMDPLLEQYESEYHYLFKRVYEEAQRGSGGPELEECYAMPNIARRLVEAFLSFRFPACTGDLFRQLEAVPFDAPKKARILRFLHTHSHHGHVAEPEHDPSALAETGAVLGDVLDLIEATDPTHYRGMKELVTVGLEAEGPE